MNKGAVLLPPSAEGRAAAYFIIKKINGQLLHPTHDEDVISRSYPKILKRLNRT
jgi:hypothetical protein